MKITPLILFFILLVVLVMSIIFSRYLPLKNTQEGLINYNKGDSHTENVNLPFYDKDSSRKVTQVYDSIYFDQKNGNLIEVFVKDSSESGNSVVSSISVTDRNKNQKIYDSDASGSTEHSKIESVASSTKRFFYVSTEANSNDVNSDKYLVLYIAYGTSTILYIFKDIGSSTLHKYNLIKSALFKSGSSKTIIDWSSLDLNASKNDSKFDINNIDLTKNSPLDTDKENIMSTLTMTSGKKFNIYLINRTTLFDLETGTLYLLKYDSHGSDGSIDRIFDRTGTLKPDYKRPINPSLITATSPWAVIDSDNNLILVYPFSTKTVISILRGNDYTGNMEVRNVIYFEDEKTIYGVGPIGDDKQSDSSSGSSSSSSSGQTGTQCSVTDYKCLFENLMKMWFPNGTQNTDYSYDLWLAYFNSLVSAGDSNDYLLKTQVVPPVCPSCPSCNCNEGVCNTCGGNGGSGTNTDKTAGSTGSKGTSTTDKILNTGYKDDDRFHGPGIGETVSNISGDVTGLLGSTVGTAGNVLGSTVGTAGGIVNTAVNTAGGLLYSAGSGAVNLLRSGQQQGPVGLNYQSQQPGVQQRDNYYSQGKTNTPIDNYSQYGALQSRAGNYMPMTADFSSFGK